MERDEVLAFIANAIDQQQRAICVVLVAAIPKSERSRVLPLLEAGVAEMEQTGRTLGAQLLRGAAAMLRSAG